jgi:uncharacterized alpha-E superfamily protein
MARYIERAENVARFIDVNLHMLLDLPMRGAEQWEPLVMTTGDWSQFLARYRKATGQNVIQFLTFDQDNPNSILSCLNVARDDARSMRETISSDMWEQLNQFFLMVNGVASDGGHLESPYAFFDAIKKGSQLFDGITMATLSHGEAWHFYLLGRLLERADKTSRLLDFKYFFLLPSAADIGTPVDDIQWAAVLRSASGFEMYRKRHAEIAPDRIVEFLLLDHQFPRSVQYCVTHTDSSVHAISGTPAGMFQNSAERRLGQLRGKLAYAQVDEIIGGGLHEYLDELQVEINLAGDAISATFFGTEITEIQSQNQSSL